MRDTLARARSGTVARLRRARGRLVGSLTRVRTTRNVAALTFDDGPDPEFTPDLLRILDGHGARATFFVIGDQAEQHRDLLEDIASRGHAIGNHTWDHRSMPGLSASERTDQLRRCGQAIEPWGAALFRPPRGLQTPASYFAARRAGYTVVTWSGNIEDWTVEPADEFARRLANRVQPGAIVLLHDSLRGPMRSRALDRGPVFEAVDRVLDEMASSYTFLTVPELVRVGSPVYEPWFVATDDGWDAPEDTR